MNEVENFSAGLQRLLSEHGEELPAQQRDLLLRVLNRIRTVDSSTVTKALRMLGLIEGPTRARLDIDSAVEVLRAALRDDQQFRTELARLSARREATKASLVAIYKQLYRRTSGVRSSISREEILQLISDERNILKRHGTLDALARTPSETAAE